MKNEARKHSSSPSRNKIRPDTISHPVCHRFVLERLHHCDCQRRNDAPLNYRRFVSDETAILTGSLTLLALLLVIGTAVKADPITLTTASLSAGSTNTLTLQGAGLNVQLNFQSQPLPYAYEQGLTTVSLSLAPTSGAATGPLVINGVNYAGSNVTGQATMYLDLRHPDGLTATDTRTITGSLKVTDPNTGITLTTLDFSFTATVKVTLGQDPCGCK